MKRKIYDKLLEWKKNHKGDTALLIEGARRIGKSYIVEEFARKEYESYILVDFSKVNPQVMEFFNLYLDDLDMLFMSLELYFRRKLTPRQTKGEEARSLVIFDEVQFCPRARAAIKHLVADRRYDYIETGSLISIKKNVKDIMLPSEEHAIEMFPMDFEEFLWAMGDEMLMPYIRMRFDKRLPMEAFHRRAMDYFRQYLIVGGMPQAVLKYVETRDFEKVDEAAHFIPSGREVWEGRQEKFDLTDLHCYRELKDAKRLARSLGTLGGGNHFIEIDEAADGTKYLIIHSGSRNLGKQVAELYQKLAINLNCGYGEYLEKRDEIIRTYKEQGRKSEIQSALKQIRWQVHESTASIPEDLCYLEGKYLEDYLHDVKICQVFARRSREKIAEIILKRTGMNGCDAFHTIHNYIDTDEMILRKGAIAAHKGERVLIPINMKDGSILAIGKGNPEWNYSAPHGAGRIMSRTKAKNEINLDEYKQAMKGIYTTSVNENTLDEAPMAYKSLESTIDVIREAVDIIDVMKPIYNFKASE